MRYFWNNLIELIKSIFLLRWGQVPGYARQGSVMLVWSIQCALGHHRWRETETICYHCGRTRQMENFWDRRPTHFYWVDGSPLIGRIVPFREHKLLVGVVRWPWLLGHLPSMGTWKWIYLGPFRIEIEDTQDAKGNIHGQRVYPPTKYRYIARTLRVDDEHGNSPHILEVSLEPITGDGQAAQAARVELGMGQK